MVAVITVNEGLDVLIFEKKELSENFVLIKSNMAAESDSNDDCSTILDVPIPPSREQYHSLLHIGWCWRNCFTWPLSWFAQMGHIEDTGILGYIIIASGEEITIITNEEEYLSWYYQLHQWKVKFYINICW